MQYYTYKGKIPSKRNFAKKRIKSSFSHIESEENKWLKLSVPAKNGNVFYKAGADGMFKAIFGDEQNKLEIAKNMLLEDIDIETISKVTDLSKEEIEGLK